MLPTMFKYDPAAQKLRVGQVSYTGWRMPTLVLNCDCGEGVADEAAILPFVTAANIACGGHTGTADTMRATLRLAQHYGLSIGAHPSYPDPAHFGRRVLPMAEADLRASLLSQMRALQAVADEMQATIAHVKLHGALYNHAAAHADVAMMVAEVVAAWNPQVVFVGMAGSPLIDAGRRVGLRVAAEGFADRAYDRADVLRSRNLPGALIEDDAAALTQAIRMVQQGEVVTYAGQVAPIHIDTICIHSDTPGAAERARILREGLERAGVVVGGFEPF